MKNVQKYISLYRENQNNWNETTLNTMHEMELILIQSEIDEIEKVLGEFCFC